MSLLRSAGSFLGLHRATLLDEDPDFHADAFVPPHAITDAVREVGRLDGWVHPHIGFGAYSSVFAFSPSLVAKRFNGSLKRDPLHDAVREFVFAQYLRSEGVPAPEMHGIFLLPPQKKNPSMRRSVLVMQHIKHVLIDDWSAQEQSLVRRLYAEALRDIWRCGLFAYDIGMDHNVLYDRRDNKLYCIDLANWSNDPAKISLLQLSARFAPTVYDLGSSYRSVLPGVVVD